MIYVLIIAIIFLGTLAVYSMASMEQERMRWEKERETLLNRIQDPDAAVWHSIVQPNADELKDHKPVGLEAVDSQAEEGEMFLVGKVVPGDFNKENDKKK